MKNRLKEFRKKRNLTQKDIGDILGVNPETVGRFESGLRKLTFEHVETLSKKLKCQPYEFFPIEWHPIEAKKIKVIGFVQAGVWREAIQWDENDYYSMYIPGAEQYEGKNLYALEVRGESMNKVYPEGSCIICMPIFEYDKEIKSGLKVICQRTNPSTGEVEATVKEYVMTEDGSVYLVPHSTNPAFTSCRMDTGECGETEITAVVIGSYKKEAT